MNTLIVLAATLFVECENFDKLGGWTVETQSMRQLGSSYVMAHGMGVPVADAVTSVTFPEAGEYAVWARTRNWNAEWTKGAAGRFEVWVEPGNAAGCRVYRSSPLGADADKEWHWQKAGVAKLARGAYRARLHDLTGFNGRCDALYFTTEGDVPPEGRTTRSARGADPTTNGLEVWRHAKTGIKVVDDPETYDLIVVGGGMAGCCAALTASRSGVKTLLLQDRDVLGGCNSSEVRVGLGGRMHTAPYPALGEVVRDIQPLVSHNSPLDAKYYEDERKATAFELKDIRTWPGWSVYTAAKAGLSKFSHALYAELRPHGVRVFCVTPSWGQTDFNRACGIAGASEDPALATKCIAPDDMGRLVVQLLETSDHLAIPDVTLQPTIQAIEPM